MANYIFTNNSNSFTLTLNGTEETLPRNLFSARVNSTNNQILQIHDTSQNGYAIYIIDLNEDTVEVDGNTTFADALSLKSALEPLFFLTNSGGGGGSSNLIIQSTPPSDTSKIWFNTSDTGMYFYDGTDWVSEQLYEVIFNDQGATANNTWLRTGNTLGNDQGNGYNVPFTSKIISISFNRSPTTAQIGNYWLYSNTQTGTEFASVVTVFAVDTSSRGSILPNVDTTIDQDKYISMRWNGNQTNNNIVTLKYRKKYI
jgi:hypothetical protein